MNTHTAPAIFIISVIILLCVIFIDQPLSLALRALEADTPAITNFFRTITHIAKSWWMLTGLAIMAAGFYAAWKVTGKRDYQSLAVRLLFMFACIAAAGLMTDGLKIIFGRARPVLLDQENIFSFGLFEFASRWHSFPSGHATNIFALAFSALMLLRVRSAALSPPDAEATGCLPAAVSP